MSEQGWTGELFLSLATEGRLVVDAARADEMIADLEVTLDMITARLRVLRIWQDEPGPTVDDLPPQLAQSLIDVVFAEQLAPGQLERAEAELPKYIRALRVARRPVKNP